MPNVETLNEWLDEVGLGSPLDPSASINSPDLNLEDLYTRIEEGVSEPARRDAILATLDEVVIHAVSFPVAETRNQPERSCVLHKALVGKLTPGDSIVSFNYDSLIDDALLHHSERWHPLTGYGFHLTDVFGGGPPAKRTPFRSDILLVKPHGSVTFRWRLRNGSHEIRFVGLSNGISPLTMRMDGGWDFLIVPPSKGKASHRWYRDPALRAARTCLTRADEIIVIGYSFPANDPHVGEIFAGTTGRLTVVDPNAANEHFLGRLRMIGLSLDCAYGTFDEFLSVSA